MEINSDVAKAIENIFPELLPQLNIKQVPAAYSPEEFKKRLRNADIKDVLLLADHIMEQKNEFLQSMANMTASEIAARIKSADELYTINDNALAKSYPSVYTGNAIIFFDKTEAEKYISEYTKNENLEAVKLKEWEILEFFNALTRFGVEFVAVEPTRCKIVYKQKQLMKTDFDSVSDPSVNFNILRYLQVKNGNGEPDFARMLMQKMIASVANSTLACMGITVNGNFEALLITDKRDDSKWIPCFTDTTEIQETYTTIPAIAKLMMTSQVVTTSFIELEKYMMLENVAGAVINIGGCGLRLDRQICLEMIANVKKNQSRGN